MPFRLVTGRANAGKTGLAYAMLRDELRRGGEPVLVVPNSADERRARDEFSREFPMGVRVMRFDRFVSSLWDAYGDGRAIARDTQRALLMRASADGLPPGIVRLACRAVEHLADAAGASWRDARGAGDLGRLVASYAEATRSAGLVELGEAADLAVRAASQRPTLLVVHRFSELTSAQERLVRALHEAGWSVAVTLTWERDFPPTEGVTGLVERLVVLGTHEHVSPKKGVVSEPELARIEADLFQLPAPGPAGGAVAFSLAQGEEAEADRIAAEVLRLVSEGIAPEATAIVYRDPERHRAMLGHALAEAGIDADYDLVLPFGATPFGRAMRCLLAYTVGGTREDLLGFLRSGCSGADAGAVVALERQWREKGVRDRARLTGDARSLGRHVKQTLGDAAATSGGTPAFVRRWESIARRMISSAYGREGRILSDVELDAAAVSVFGRTLQDAAQLAEIAITAQSLLAALEHARVALGQSERPGRVQVMGAERARGRRFDAVILAGLTMGEFPVLHEDPLGSGEVAALFGSVGADAPVWGGTAAERGLLYDVVTRARRRLVLSRQTADSGGSPLGASVFWEELRDFYRSPEVDAEDEPALAVDREVGLAEVGLAEHASNSERRRLRSAVAGRCEEPEGAARRLRAARRRAAACGAGLLAPENLEALASRTVFSASEIENYLQCPYKWFVSSCLRADGIDYAVDGLLVGDVVHRALCTLYAGLEEATGERRVTTRSLPAALRLAEAAVDGALDDRHMPASDRDVVRATVLPKLARHLRHDAVSLEGFIPEHREWSFGARDDEPVELGGFSLRGRIDRIDVRDGYAVVIDYKSGGARPPGEWDERGLVQLPLYSAVVRKRLGLEIAGMFYRGLSKTDASSYKGPYLEGVVHGGVNRNAAVEAEELAALIDRALERATGAVAGIRAGRIPATGEDDACTYCAARGYCAAGGM